MDEVTIWLNGGPGCSSLEGFFQENGRFLWHPGTLAPVENPYSWVNLTNMLWYDPWAVIIVRADITIGSTNLLERVSPPVYRLQCRKRRLQRTLSSSSRIFRKSLESRTSRFTSLARVMQAAMCPTFQPRFWTKTTRNITTSQVNLDLPQILYALRLNYTCRRPRIRPMHRPIRLRPTSSPSRPIRSRKRELLQLQPVFPFRAGDSTREMRLQGLY